jgi:hypothetical protein
MKKAKSSKVRSAKSAVSKKGKKAGKPFLQVIWGAKSTRHAESLDRPLLDLKSEASFHLQALWLRSLHDEDALTALADLLVKFSEAASTSCVKSGHGKVAKKFDALVYSFVGEPASLKHGHTSKFCSVWLEVAALEVAGGPSAPSRFPMPPIDVVVKKAVEVIASIHGADWQDHPEVASVFRPLRSNWGIMSVWEKRSIVRQALKSAARTYHRQAVRAKMAGK